MKYIDKNNLQTQLKNTQNYQIKISNNQNSLITRRHKVNGVKFSASGFIDGFKVKRNETEFLWPVEQAVCKGFCWRLFNWFTFAPAFISAFITFK